MGRPSKGERRFVAGKLPMALATAAGAQVPDRYATVSDLIQAALAEHVGMPEYAPAARLDQVENLSLFEVRGLRSPDGRDGVKYIGARVPMPLYEVVSEHAKRQGSLKDVLQAALAEHLDMPQYMPARMPVDHPSEELLMIAG